MKKGLLTMFLFVLAIAARMPAAGAQEDSVASRYQIMAAYIYNFTQFTTWPSGAIGSEFSVCVVGDNPFGPALGALRSRTVDDRKIATKIYRSASGGMSACNVLFVADSERADVGEIIKALKGAPILTMSDMDGFTAAGGMVAFDRNGQKVGIKVSLRAVQAAGLSVSSKLLRIADTAD